MTLVLLRPPTPLAAESVQDVPVIGDSWSKATFLRRLREAIFSTGKRLEKAQERYKRDFDKGVASVNRHLKAGDQAFLDVRGTPAVGFKAQAGKSVDREARGQPVAGSLYHLTE